METRRRALVDAMTPLENIPHGHKFAWASNAPYETRLASAKGLLNLQAPCNTLGWYVGKAENVHATFDFEHVWKLCVTSRVLLSLVFRVKMIACRTFTKFTRGMTRNDAIVPPARPPAHRPGARPQSRATAAQNHGANGGLPSAAAAAAASACALSMASAASATSRTSAIAPTPTPQWRPAMASQPSAPQHGVRYAKQRAGAYRALPQL